MVTKNVALLGVSTALVGGSVAGGVYFINSGDTIGITLSKEIKLLTSNSQEHWELKLHNYETHLKTNNLITFKKTGWEGLKEWCKETLDKKFSSKDKEYENAKALCSVPSNKEKLEKLTKKVTGVDWADKASKYQSERDANTLIEGIEKTSAKNTDIEAWCGKAINFEYTSITEGSYSKTLKWCTQEGQ